MMVDSKHVDFTAAKIAGLLSRTRTPICCGDDGSPLLKGGTDSIVSLAFFSTGNMRRENKWRQFLLQNTLVGEMKRNIREDHCTAEKTVGWWVVAENCSDFFSM
jgi:hypothetical protein